MKAAVLHERDGVPRYEEFPEPVAGEGEVIVEVVAVAVENVDRAVAAGTHYAAGEMMPDRSLAPVTKRSCRVASRVRSSIDQSL